MEKNEVSLHQLKVYLFVRDAKKWVTNVDITNGVGFSNRTVRMHTKNFVELGIFDHVEVFPGHRFKVADKPEVRNKAYFQRLQQAIEVFGLAAA